MEEPLPSVAQRAPALTLVPRDAVAPLKVAVVLPVRDSARTVRQCLTSLMAQDYPFFHVYVVSGPRHEDQSAASVPDLISDSRITWLEWPRPFEWEGRDGSAKRQMGANIALSDGADVVAFIDSQVEAPPAWLSTGVRLLEETGTDGIAGVSRRRPEDRSFAAVYQDCSIFSEWPNYREDQRLFDENSDRVGQLPVTNNLLVRSEALEPVLGLWPDSCPFGWEDFHLDHALLQSGASLLCTGRSRVYRLHKPKLRLAKHVTAGMAAADFYRAFPKDRFIRRRLFQAALVTAAAAVTAGLVAVSIALSSLALGLFVAGTIALAAIGLSAVSVRSARDWRAVCFPLVVAIHIVSWMAGLLVSVAGPASLKQKVQLFLAPRR